jgi:predicted DNA-binding protein
MTGQKSTSIHLPPDLHRRLKIQAARESRTILDLVTDIMGAYLKGQK